MTDRTYAYDFDEAVAPTPVPGTMEQYDRNSLGEIKTKIAARTYRDAKEVREHMLFLERLADKLQSKYNLEQSEGESGWGLKIDLDKVKDTFKILARLLETLE